MKILALALVCIVSLAHAEPGAEPSPRELHAAACVAALEADTQALAERVKAGNDASRALLFDRLIAGTAFVGDTYLHGGTDEKHARALADLALEAQKRLRPAELAARQVACAVEGKKLYADSNGLEKVVVKRLAKKRMDRLLGA